MWKIIFSFLLFHLILTGCSKKVRLENAAIKIEWTQKSEGWIITSFQVKSGKKQLPWGHPDGKTVVLFSKEKPCGDSVLIVQSNGDTVNFNLASLNLPQNFKNAASAVPMNQAGEKYEFYPESCTQIGQSISFTWDLEIGRIIAIWELDEKHPSDIRIKTRFIAAKKGYYSLSSVTPARINPSELIWGIVPGFYQGNRVNENFTLSYLYAQGLPEFPVLCRESTVTNPMAALTDRDSCTLAIIIEPGQESPRYEHDKNLHNQKWRIALSHMNPGSQLVPTAYHPVLGEEGSLCQINDTIKFDYRFSLQKGDWYQVFKHSVYDVYRFKDMDRLRSTEMSLTDRVLAMYDYLVDDKTSQWHEEDYHGTKIGAQGYGGAAYGSDNDAMKNSDIAAVWMLTALTGDKVLKETRIPYIRNFKIAQQQSEPGFFEGAALGQYYLAKSKTFMEEWGSQFEPIGLTYYTLIDIGNILLFQPNDKELLSKLKAGADRLLAWQCEDGSWPVAFDRHAHQPIFTDLTDLRPTFYGMYVAYKILRDQKYLDGATKGADWFVKNATEKGSFLGVCGDARFVNDFATGQSAQALLDMYDLTANGKYLDAAVKTAQMYTTSIFTYPIPTTETKIRKGKEWKDWQLSQVGLSFEHGGAIGSAVVGGPILLASHAGMFVRMFEITKDSLFLDMARAGVLGRDAFVNPKTHVASYYWKDFDRGSGLFPHHAWWQVGWIMDYLVAEMELRSNGKIAFPRGFVTPKVGPHQPVGFAQGFINGEKATLILPQNLIKSDNPNVDYLLLQTDHSIYLILMNEQARTNSVTWNVWSASDVLKPYKVSAYSGKIPKFVPWGLEIIKIGSK